jgi:hypothetical protein
MKSSWPSIKEQVDAERITRGSALEQLIKENQDFTLLDPREADDDADLPLWLRVYWRKNHPDAEHSAVNPGGGYPDTLYDIKNWMLAHHDLPWGTAGNPTPGIPAPANPEKGRSPQRQARRRGTGSRGKKRGQK